jgi:parallel beta-helix repeat protein
MAVENKYRITVNTKSKMFRDIPEIVQNDNVIFQIDVYDGATLFALDPTYSYKLVSQKLSGQSTIRNGVLNNGLIEFTLGTSEMTEPGKVEATVQIYDSAMKRISSAKFDYVVKKDPSLQGSLPADDTSLVIANESLLTEAINKSNAADERVTNLINSSPQPSEVVDARGGFPVLRDRLNNVDASLADMATNPKSYGAKGDGVTDDTNSFNQALQNGRLLVTVNPTYLIKSPLLIPDNIVKIDGRGCKIIFQYEQTGSGYESLFYTSDRKTPLTIENMELQYNGTFDTGSSYSGNVCGIDIRTQTGFAGLTIKNVEVHGFNSAGIQIGFGGQYITDVLIDKCYLHHNRVAGAWYGNVDVLTVRDCRAEYNGLSTDNGTGYGFAGISTYYPKNVTVKGCTARYNYRKGIDFHSGYNISINDNTCDNNRYWGIYVVTQNVVNSVVQPTGFIHITNNRIVNMSNDSANNPPQLDIYGIAVGKSIQGEGTTSGYKTEILIQGNTFNNINVQNSATCNLIQIVPTGFEACDISINNNLVNVKQIDSLVRVQEDNTITGGKTNIKIHNNVTKILTCRSTTYYVRSGTNLRKLEISDGDLEIVNPYTQLTLCNFADANPNIQFSDAIFTFYNNVLTINIASWGSYDPIAIYGKPYIYMTNNVFNGSKYRDYDGVKYISKGNAAPASGSWLNGSIVYNTAPAASGNIGWVYLSSGSVWKTFGTISA